MTCPESRARSAEGPASVNDDREEAVTAGAGCGPVVIVSPAEYESPRGTVHLLRGPADARCLLASIERPEHGGGTAREPVRGERRSSSTGRPGPTTRGGGSGIAGGPDASAP
jgi:antitoxin YefM